MVICLNRKITTRFTLDIIDNKKSTKINSGFFNLNILCLSAIIWRSRFDTTFKTCFNVVILKILRKSPISPGSAKKSYLKTKKLFVMANLKPLVFDENLIIEALDGKVTIVKAKKVFKAGIDSDFKNWGLDKPGEATKEVYVDGCAIIEDSKFDHISASPSDDLDKLCFTQAQIIRLCKKYPRQFGQEGGVTSFLFKVDNKYFIAGVRVRFNGLDVGVRRFGRGSGMPSAVVASLSSTSLRACLA